MTRGARRSYKESQSPVHKEQMVETSSGTCFTPVHLPAFCLLYSLLFQAWEPPVHREFFPKLTIMAHPFAPQVPEWDPGFFLKRLLRLTSLPLRFFFSCFAVFCCLIRFLTFFFDIDFPNGIPPDVTPAKDVRDPEVSTSASSSKSLPVVSSTTASNVSLEDRDIDPSAIYNQAINRQ